MKRILSQCLLSAGLACLATGAYAANSSCPTQFNPGSFTKGNFFANFNSNCYLIPFSTGSGSAHQWGDLDTYYNKIYFQLNPDIPPYQLVILGEFPNARYFSISINDDHSAVSQHLTDVDIVPLTSGDINPYQPGVAFVSGQQYAVPVNLGGTPGALEPGCTTNGTNFDVNAMDGTQRHPFMNWNFDTAFFHANPTMPTANGDVYGTTALGGLGNGGTFFRFTAGGTLTTLYKFCSERNCTASDSQSSRSRPPANRGSGADRESAAFKA
jgi:uncharacterized repeat protein (TIGR03803 family)